MSPASRQGTATPETSPHREPLEALGLSESAVGCLAAYLDTLAAWSRRLNLTAARGPAGRVRLLVAPVLPALSVPEPGRLIDIGSGNGSPGLIFALLRADLEVTLLEPRSRRWAFLREAARAAGTRVSVLRQRHDAYAGPPARTLTLRALALPLGELASLVEAGGHVVWFGSRLEASGPFEPARVGECFPEGVQVFRRLG